MVKDIFKISCLIKFLAAHILISRFEHFYNFIMNNIVAPMFAYIFVHYNFQVNLRYLPLVANALALFHKSPIIIFLRRTNILVRHNVQT